MERVPFKKFLFGLWQFLLSLILIGCIAAIIYQNEKLDKLETRIKNVSIALTNMNENMNNNEIRNIVLRLLFK